ncbi:hypothetical protein ACHHYP_13283 [Achlya hypogyna]|uniref:INTS8 TPR repeats domain-containing protein n=1 Tax=Achlya hypogyna TaxID=1202772 RepID=A0A1V9YFV2_ACHHY|nr:hypothetical protein ACHHYP_13283 [Achlya hypogyna]
MAACPGTPRPSAQEVQDVIDKRDMVFGLGGNAELSPRPSPRNPSRGVPTPDRTYRSLFQQPAIDVQLAHTEADWYDFLFHPTKLLEHTRALLVDPTCTPTAHDVLTELLKKAKPPVSVYAAAPPPTTRQVMLLCLAALVVLQLRFDLDDIEATVPTHLQNLLLDGLVEYANNPRVLKLHEVEPIGVDEAQVLRARWQLRVAVKKMHVSPLTLVGKLPLSDNTKPPPDEVEQLNGIMLPPPSQVLDDLARLLASGTLSNRNSIHHLALMDMGVYHFHKKQFKPALELFSRARAAVSTEVPALDGYIQACEAVLNRNVHKADEPFQEAWKRHDYTGLLALLQTESIKKAAQQPVALSQQFLGYIEAQLLQALLQSHDDELAALEKLYLALLVHQTLRSSDLAPVKTALCRYHRVPRLDKHMVFFVSHTEAVLAASNDAHVRALLAAVQPQERLSAVASSNTTRQRLHHAAIVAPGTAEPSAVTTAVLALLEFTDSPADFGVKKAVAQLEAVVLASRDAKHSAAAVVELPVAALDTVISLCAGLLQRAYSMNLCEYRVSFDLVPYGDLAVMLAFGPNDAAGPMDPVQSMKMAQSDVVKLHGTVLAILLERCPREPRWHCAMADVCVNPIVLQKVSSVSDFKSALRHYLAAASLATNFFAAGTVEHIDHSSLVRLSHCLVKVGAHVPAAVLYQTFAPDEVVYGLRILQLAPHTHDAAFFQYFYELSFLEMLVHLHANGKQRNAGHVQLLTQLIQCPELNASNPASSKREMEQRILRSFFRELCRVYLVPEQ